MNDEIEYHVARVLVLLKSMNPAGGELRGLTKLVKLDFLLRYPSFLDRLLRRREVAWPSGLEPSEAERLAVESPMIRHKYGPWDDRYYPILGYLSGTGLATIRKDRGAITIRLTSAGRRAAESIESDPNWSTVAARARLLKSEFDMSGSALKDTIYAELPDVVDRPHRMAI
jgi:hypothetical protein